MDLDLKRLAHRFVVEALEPFGDRIEPVEDVPVQGRDAAIQLSIRVHQQARERHAVVHDIRVGSRIQLRDVRHRGAISAVPQHVVLDLPQMRHFAPHYDLKTRRHEAPKKPDKDLPMSTRPENTKARRHEDAKNQTKIVSIFTATSIIPVIGMETPQKTIRRLRQITRGGPTATRMRRL